MTVQCENIFVALALLGCVSGAPAQERAQAAGGAGARHLEVVLHGGRLTAVVRNCPLQDVAAEAGAKTRVAIIPSADVADELVSVEVRDAALDAGLRAIFGTYDLFLFYGDAAGSANAPLRKVWIYPKGRAGQLQPVAPSEWASGKELETALASAGPEVRAEVYESLMTNPVRREVALQAIRGERGESDELRARVLASAISMGVPLSAELLGDLAAADPSEQVRWMALDASAHQSAGKEIARHALSDPSESVREKAKEILSTNEPEPNRTAETAPGDEAQR